MLKFVSMSFYSESIINANQPPPLIRIVILKILGLPNNYYGHLNREVNSTHHDAFLHDYNAYASKCQISGHFSDFPIPYFQINAHFTMKIDQGNV